MSPTTHWKIHSSRTYLSSGLLGKTTSEGIYCQVYVVDAHGNVGPGLVTPPCCGARSSVAATTLIDGWFVGHFYSQKAELKWGGLTSRYNTKLRQGLLCHSDAQDEAPRQTRWCLCAVCGQLRWEYPWEVATGRRVGRLVPGRGLWVCHGRLRVLISSETVP
jgi:hypothetical protein